MPGRVVQPLELDEVTRGQIIRQGGLKEVNGARARLDPDQGQLLFQVRHPLRGH
jgi:hypothetical protein